MHDLIPFLNEYGSKMLASAIILVLRYFEKKAIIKELREKIGGYNE